MMAPKFVMAFLVFSVSFIWSAWLLLRPVTIEANAPYLQQVQKVAKDHYGDLSVWMWRGNLLRECEVSISLTTDGDRRTVRFYGDTYEQAAQKVVERMGKP